MEAYCVKCKTKREIKDPKAVFTGNNTPATSGYCDVCGTKLFRMGRTEAHQGLEPPVKAPPPRNGKLVIVESPTKAKTVGRFLGKDYKVVASVGHVRDLLRSQLSVDVENNFEPKYRVPNDKRQVVKEIKNKAKQAEVVYLATDPDREGEAIAWHLIAAAEIDPARINRVVFHEITEPAIAEAFGHTREVNIDLVNAQQARRILDRLVGYNLTPLLWRKVRGRLSAGRVQSVALRLIVEREREIENFIPEEYWTIKGEFKPEDRKDTFYAKLHRIDDEEPVLANQDAVDPILADLRASAYTVSGVKLGQRKRTPSAPFTTSTLQQDSSRRLGFASGKTMRIAQQLYEGIDTGEGGEVGLITYMRTDSTNVSELAQSEARAYVEKRYGGNYLPEKPPVYTTRSRGAQEAHEAIRPTSVMRTPGSLKQHLSRDQYRLYDLIWKRFVASQMAPAVYDTISVDVQGISSEHTYLFRATGSTLNFPGFLALYEEAKGVDSLQNGEDTESRVPVDLVEGLGLALVDLIPEQHFTQPPYRYSEASLIRTLEEYGIGRPSTYAPIIATIQNRGYVEKLDKRLCPTETGFVVNDLLVEQFPDVLDVAFTAHMEEDLDLVASGEMEWVDVVREFYVPFIDQVHQAEKAIPEVKLNDEKVGRNCPQCGHELIIRWGRFGRFISCSNFPKCRYTEPFLEKIGVKCPQDDGEIVLRKTRKGRIFYGCTNYPDCQFTSWKKPVPTPCPRCQGLMVEQNKNHVECTVCEAKFLRTEVIPQNVEEIAE